MGIPDTRQHLISMNSWSLKWKAPQGLITWKDLNSKHLPESFSQKAKLCHPMYKASVCLRLIFIRNLNVLKSIHCNAALWQNLSGPVVSFTVLSCGIMGLTWLVYLMWQISEMCLSGGLKEAHAFSHHCPCEVQGSHLNVFA